MEQTRENKMGVMPINKLLISMSLPMMISMLVQALYNIVDSVFVSRLSENALTAVSMAFPMQNLMISVGAGLGVGMNALLSRSLGEKNFKGANKTAMNGLFLEVIGYLIFLVIGIFATKIFFLAQAGESEITNLGVSYTRICLIMSFGIFMQFTFERMLQSTGRTFLTMITQTTGAVINIILDPILIFGLLGMPKLGVQGAALATVIGQIIAAALALMFNLKKNPDVNLDFKHFKPEMKYIKTILSVGVPSIIMASVGSVMTFGMNKILIAFSSTAVAVFGVYFKLNSFIFMPVFGLNNGMVPIVSYNYGARKKERMTKTIKFAIIYAVALMCIGIALFQFIPDVLLGLFDASEYMLEIGAPALRIISLSFAFAGICIVLSSCFQALGHGFLSMFVSITRQLIVLLPSAFILSKIGGLNAVWWSFNIAEIFSLSLSLICYRHLYNKIIKPLEIQNQ
ncbi:MAG: MATE family efflux transporter [Oscillospiraceae bacterium]|nr:MATE family efflux transporter [Oscillospiraceae bacterium]